MFKKDSPQQKAQKQRNLAEARKDLPELLGLGYQVHEFMPWHWRITRAPDWQLEVDVWPTSKKLCVRDGYWSARTYAKDLLTEIEAIFTSDQYMP